MIDPLLCASFATFTAMVSATFSIVVRRGQKYANASSGVLIGLITNVPFLLLGLREELLGAYGPLAEDPALRALYAGWPGRRFVDPQSVSTWATVR